MNSDKLLLLYALLLFVCCSSKQATEHKKNKVKKVSERQFEIKPSLTFLDSTEKRTTQVVIIDDHEIPETLKKLYSYKNKNSAEFEIISYKAAIDTKNSVENALSSLDSARALKILHYALRHLSYRSDLKELKNKALTTFIEITKDLGNNETLDCDLFFTRVDFLKVVAPDASARVVTPLRCKNESKSPKQRERFKFVVKDEDINNDFTYIPTRYEELEEKYKADLEKKIDFYIKRNTTFPYEQLIKNSFWYLGEVYANNQILCELPIVNPNSISKKNIKVSFKCAFGSKNLKNRPLQYKVESKYCDNLKSELSIPGGENKFFCRQDEPFFKTSKIIADKFNFMFNKFEFSCGMPKFLIAKLKLLYKTGKKKVFKFLTNINHCESDINHQYGSSKYTVLDFFKYNHLYIDDPLEYLNIDSPRLCQVGGDGNGECFFGHTKNDYSSSITVENLQSNQLEGLIGVRLGIDYESSYKAYSTNIKVQARKRESCQELLYNEGLLNDPSMRSQKSNLKKLRSVQDKLKKIDCFRDTKTYMGVFMKKNWKKYAE